MRAYTISKLLTTKNINTNTPDVIAPIITTTQFRRLTNFCSMVKRKKALKAFKHSVSGEKIKIEDLQNAANQEILAELSL